MNEMAGAAYWLPIIFLVLMAIAMLAYVILDGYDLGVGILLRAANDEQKDTMIASIGPFWDANETWLVLGVGLLLVAFPLAHGVILRWLYLPTALMLIGLILRGVAFDFRVKAQAQHKPLWDTAFFVGSLLAAICQGYMLGMTIIGFQPGIWGILFGAMIGLCLTAGYGLLGSTWLIMKTEGELQLKAVYWALRSLGWTGLGIAAVSIATPIISERIFDKWFGLPWIFLLSPIPLATAVLFLVIFRTLKRLPVRLQQGNEYGIWVPFACTVGIFLLAFYGLAYSLYPYLVIDRLTIWQAAASPESLKIILVGAVIVLPTIIGYTIFAYRVFWGKATALRYD